MTHNNGASKYQIGDLVIVVSNGQEQTAPLKVAEVQEHNGGFYYRLDDDTTSTSWPEESLQSAAESAQIDVVDVLLGFQSIINGIGAEPATVTGERVNNVKLFLSLMSDQDRKKVIAACRREAVKYGLRGDRACYLIGIPMPRNFLIEETPDDEGNAKCVQRLYGDRFVFCPAIGWLQYDGKRWESELAEQELDKAILYVLKERRIMAIEADREHIVKVTKGSDRNIRATKSILSSLQALPASTFDSDCWLFNCRNGTLDLRTGELHEHDPNNYITKLAPVDYNPDATAPRWEKFLTEIFPNDEELQQFVTRAIGYSLTGSVVEQCLFFAHGVGRNGKSTFFETLLALFGDYGQKTATSALMATNYDGTGPTPYIARLKGMRFVVAAELEQGRRFSESVVKDLTGGDRVIARHLHRNPFEFDPTHSLWIYGNHKPEIRGTDDAIWRRIKLIPFNVQFKSKDANGAQKADKDLPMKLKTELSGILNLALQACLKWQSDHLATPDAVKNATGKYREEQDEIASFFDDCCVLTDRARIPKGQLYAEYEKWGGTKTKRQFGMALLERGYQDTKSTGGVRVWIGIGITV